MHFISKINTLHIVMFLLVLCVKSGRAEVRACLHSLIKSKALNHLMVVSVVTWPDVFIDIFMVQFLRCFVQKQL